METFEGKKGGRYYTENDGFYYCKYKTKGAEGRLKSYLRCKESRNKNFRCPARGKMSIIPLTFFF